MGKSEADRLKLKVPESEPKLPFSWKAKIRAFSRGIPYSQALQEIVDEEIKENKEDRADNHAP